MPHFLVNICMVLSIELEMKSIGTLVKTVKHHNSKVIQYIRNPYSKMQLLIALLNRETQ